MFSSSGAQANSAPRAHFKAPEVRRECFVAVQSVSRADLMWWSLDETKKKRRMHFQWVCFFSFSPFLLSLSLSFSPNLLHLNLTQGRYELVCERAHGLVPFSPLRTTRLTLATPGCSPAAEARRRSGGGDENENGDDATSPLLTSSSPQQQQRQRHFLLRGPRDEFLLFNVGEVLNVAPLFQIDRQPLRSLVFDGRSSSASSSFVPPPSASSFLRATTPVCHSWRPLPPALRGREPDVLVGLAGGAVVALSLELELNEAAAEAEEEEARRRGQARGGRGEEEANNGNGFSFPTSSSLLNACSSPVAAQVLWPPAEISPASTNSGGVGGADFDDNGSFAAAASASTTTTAAAAVSPSLASRVVAVAWAPGSRAVVVHGCGLVAVHEPPWRLERAGGAEAEDDAMEEEEEGEDDKRYVFLIFFFFFRFVFCFCVCAERLRPENGSFSLSFPLEQRQQQQQKKTKTGQASAAALRSSRPPRRRPRPALPRRQRTPSTSSTPLRLRLLLPS